MRDPPTPIPQTKAQIAAQGPIHETLQPSPSRFARVRRGTRVIQASGPVAIHVVTVTVTVTVNTDLGL